MSMWIKPSDWEECHFPRPTPTIGEQVFVGIGGRGPGLLAIAKLSDGGMDALLRGEAYRYRVEFSFLVTEGKRRELQCSEFESLVSRGWVAVLEDANDLAAATAQRVWSLHPSIRAVGADHWVVASVVDALSQKGQSVQKFRNAPQCMTPAAAEVEAQVFGRTLAHHGNPVMEWMLGQAIRLGGDGPRLKYGSHDISGPLALCVAMGLAQNAMRQPGMEVNAYD